MDFDKWAKLLTLLVSLLQAVGWPLLLLIILLYLRVPLKKFLGDIIEVTLKAGPIETTAKRQQAIEVAASLGAASAIANKEDRAKEQGNNPVSVTENARTIAKLVDQSINSQVSKKLGKASILWVDDKPSNNTYERNALEALGIKFTICISTEDALEQLQHNKFDAIISDMGRPPDQRAGYTLLEKVQNLKYGSIPFIIYASGGNREENKAEALKRGAFASTSGPQRLFELVVKTIEKSD